jgi:oligopeptide/dipeptide ABC transporter ATP-binding protein
MSAPALEIRGLVTGFDTDDGFVRAVDGVNLTLGRGRVLAIVGESGCGKSVTAYSILRLIRPPGRIAEGSILFHPSAGGTTDIAALPDNSPELRRIRGGSIGMIFQEPLSALSPVHTIGDQVGEVLRLHRGMGRAEAAQRAAEMLTRVGLPMAGRRLDQYPHELSGGMRQRVVIAMALICEPEILIADEPTTALDVTIQAQILWLIKELQQARRTSVLFITHDLGVVAQMADDVAVMYLGRVVESGPVREVLRNPLHPYTRGLLRSRPASSAPGQRLETIPGSVPPLTAIPRGCPFHPRCPHAAFPVCDAGASPALRELNPGHATACLRAEEIGASISHG